MPETHEFFTVTDVIRAGYTLEPLRCLNTQCPDPESGNVTFNQTANDAYCSVCGKDQLPFVTAAERPVALVAGTPTTRDLMEAATCLWEQVLELRRNDANLDAAFAVHGTAVLRDMTLDIAEACHVDYARAVNQQHYQEPFDWGFVPTWLRQNVVFSANDGIKRRQ